MVEPMNEPTPNRKPRVAVVFGGRSSEHGISCVTAGSVLQAIDRDAYDVVPVGIATDGRWVLESGDPERLRIESADKLPTVDTKAPPTFEVRRTQRRFRSAGKTTGLRPWGNLPAFELPARSNSPYSNDC